jgi:hypothetical protein
MAGLEQVDLWALSDLCTPWCVHVLVTLRIAEHINARITQIDELARASGSDCESLHRVLRHMVGKGVFLEPAPGKFALNEPARGLLESGVKLGFDLSGIGGRMAYAWGSLLTAVRTGAPAYHTVFGRPFWEDLEANPDVAVSFDDLMGMAFPIPRYWSAVDGKRCAPWSMSEEGRGRCWPRSSAHGPQCGARWWICRLRQLGHSRRFKRPE